MAGDCIKTSNLISIAKQVANECARLPLAIVIVGGALSNKNDKKEWKVALQQLKMSIPHNIYGLHPKVYSSIELSYNYLRSDEAKSCFLLCCLYPEDYNVLVEDLVRYGVVKRFLKGLGTVEQTREHVHTIVKNLIRSNLLLDGDYYKDEYVKMHDVVRDVTISIASRDENGFMVVLHEELEKWPQNGDSYTTISHLLGEMKGHPTELKCPTVQLLQLLCLKHSKTFPDNLFDGMKELKMLSLQDCRSSLTMLPPSIQILQNLQMLNLEDCCLGDVSAIGTLGNLEILSFSYSKIEELPSEIGNLSRLKLLDMKGCDSLKRIAAGVLSGLSQLEELYMGRIKNWGCTTTMEGNGEKSVCQVSCACQKNWTSVTSHFRFRINICINDKSGGVRYLFENTLELEVKDASDLGEHRTIHSLLKNAVILNLDIEKNWKHIWFEKEEKGIIPCSLKNLSSCGCEDLEYLLEATSDSTPPNTFHLLQSLSLYCLPRLIGICKSTDSVEITLTKEEEQNVRETENQAKMLSLFQYNLIESLENLQQLSIHRCDSLEVIFELEGLNAEESNIFNNLTVLSLIYLPKLLHIWKKGPRDIKGFNYLRLLRVWDCGSLKCLFTPSIAKLLVKLEKIQVSSCNEMGEILGKELGDEENRDVIAFPLVKTLKLEHL
ncbi:probable disease resistance protein At4g27220 [Juglans microcarpa x Juglans regia]|uniref:probable disease resistance protein At4g27220 n=1 Tax=Juglans microcarpa x Juglans regia TaxID=2249226 RepID=UPI001B7E0E28|nr:probable disease resistance protein At4g27220 [Juglans microcarpa x Juglans regia]